jgi:7-carboxy-7-deazaguanine synthase
MRICEMFKTIQGEGQLTGVVSVLVRMWGCNLQCEWCDEKRYRKSNCWQEVPQDVLLSNIKKYGCNHIVVTGGEPLIWPEVTEFTRKLKDVGYNVTIETNATIQRKVYCDLVSMSPKLAHSKPSSQLSAVAENHERNRLNIDVINYFMKHHDYQIKFVVESEKDFFEIEDILTRISNYDETKILIMPLASSRRQLNKVQKKLVRLCVEKGYRYANRLQLQIWGARKEC